MGGRSSKSCNRNRGNDYIEQVLCNDAELSDNTMREFDVGPDGNKVLVVKQNGGLYAVGTKCSHYGAPLKTGALGDGRIRCPWHGACFSLKTGDIEDFPGLDSLPCYNVSVNSEGQIKIRAKKSDLTNNKRIKTMSHRDKCNKEKFIIIGGGPAGNSCLETLRQEGFTGQLIMLSNDEYLPYDRVKVNKQLDSDIKTIVLRTPEFYKQNDMEVHLNEEVVSIDTNRKCVKTASGKEYEFTRLFVACGAKARPVPANYENNNLKNIFTLRSLSDGNKIFKALTPESNVVILGSSFIGMEAAAFCVGKVKSVTVIGRSAFPFQENLGEKIGQAVLQLFQSKGVIMKMSTDVKGFAGADGNVCGVVLKDGTTIPADVCIAGIGIFFDTKFLSGTDVKLTDRGAIDVDENLRTNVETVFAGGDIANAPVFAYGNKKTAIGHFQLAQYHGHIAALNMLGKTTPLHAVPFFFSMLFGKGIRYAGYGAGFDDVIVNGNLSELKFVGYYCKEDKVIAVATCQKDPIAAKFAELLFQGKSLLKSQIDENDSWATAS